MVYFVLGAIDTLWSMTMAYPERLPYSSRQQIREYPGKPQIIYGQVGFTGIHYFTFLV